MWYYIKNEQVLGPISLEELVNLINAGLITKSTYVWESGKMRQQAGETEELAEFLQDDEPEPLEAQSKPLPQFTETKKVVSHKKDAGVLDSVVASTGLDNLKGFSLYDLFSETFKRHTDDEMERYFGVGTPLTTPPISQVDASWPKPWLFLRLIFLGIGGYYLSSYASSLPGMVIFGAFVIPLATLIFFFECNIVKNVSLYQIFKLFLYGGTIAFIFTFALRILFPYLKDMLDASSAGPIEESAKLLVLILVLIMGGLKRKDYVLNGLLCGAAVGAGFEAFETAGYALKQFIDGFIDYNLSYNESIRLMTENLRTRGISAHCCHIVWTAMSAAALWRVKKAKDFTISMLLNPMFLIVFSIAIALHMSFNSNIIRELSGGFLEYILGIIGWTIIFGLIGLGLRQVRQQQKYIAAKEAQRKQTVS
ncbi:MAG: PrsW family intramembrane metalloprotease [Thermoguttaceae bacterium]|nr:PrsW family intramembrane metalloprotease [Thermoguttaceae bacterium]